MLPVILGLLSLFILVQPVFAEDAPVQISPADNSTVSSSSLNWQEPSYHICTTKDTYRVQVDNDPSFPSSSIDKNTYTKNVYYSPKLALGIWYWRVMARDETCDNWSNWSPVWSFTLTDAPPSPTPNPTPSPTPDLTPNPTPNPTKTPSPTSTPKKTAIPTSVPPTPSPNPTLKNTPTSIPSSNKNTMNEFFPSEINYRIASVAATTASATSSGKIEIKNEKQINPIVWIGLIFIFAGIGIFGYIYSKNNAKIYIPFRK